MKVSDTYSFKAKYSIPFNGKDFPSVTFATIAFSEHGDCCELGERDVEAPIFY